MGSFLDSALLCLGLLGSYYFIHVLSGLCSLINHNRSRCTSCISLFSENAWSPHLSQQISDPKNIKVKLMYLLLFGYLPLFLFVFVFFGLFFCREGTTFKVIVVMPLLPAFEGRFWFLV